MLGYVVEGQEEQETVERASQAAFCARGNSRLDFKSTGSSCTMTDLPGTCLRCSSLMLQGALPVLRPQVRSAHGGETHTALQKHQGQAQHAQGGRRRARAGEAQALRAVILQSSAHGIPAPTWKTGCEDMSGPRRRRRRRQRPGAGRRDAGRGLRTFLNMAAG